MFPQHHHPFTSFVLMVEPAMFYCNRETAKDNKCQPQSLAEEQFHHPNMEPSTAIVDSAAALAEHRAVARRLSDEFGVDVHVLQSCAVEQASKPDAIFPNNSISFHSRVRTVQANAENNDAHVLPTVVLYPMSPGRRGEVPPSLMRAMQKESDRYRVVDMRHPHEQDGLAMEGTGAVNFSVDGSAMFVGISQRASAGLVPTLREQFGVPPDRVFLFHATDENGDTVYHTNVVGWVGSGICAWCFESMRYGGTTPEEEETLRQRMLQFMHQDICHGNLENVLHLTRKQMRSFAGNCLEVQRSVQLPEGGSAVVPLLCMSETAWGAFSEAQQTVLLAHYGGAEHIARFAIPTIERLGGGSVRCLLAASIPSLVHKTVAAERRHGPSVVHSHNEVFLPLVAERILCV